MTAIMILLSTIIIFLLAIGFRIESLHRKMDIKNKEKQQ